MNCSLPGSSIHEIPPGKNIGRVATPSSKGSSQPTGRTQASRVSSIAGGFFTCWATGEAQIQYIVLIISSLMLTNNIMLNLKEIHEWPRIHEGITFLPFLYWLNIILTFIYVTKSVMIFHISNFKMKELIPPNHVITKRTQQSSNILTPDPINVALRSSEYLLPPMPWFSQRLNCKGWTFSFDNSWTHWKDDLSSLTCHISQHQGKSLKRNRGIEPTLNQNFGEI